MPSAHQKKAFLICVVFWSDLLHVLHSFVVQARCSIHFSSLLLISEHRLPLLLPLLLLLLLR
jgi:hypothetical protein